MHKLKSIIVENDPKSLSLLLSLISDCCPEIEVASTATNIQDATKQILAQQPDLVFLDIELDDGLGFEVLYQIPVKKFKTIIISGYSQYALNAFEFEVAHYLLKPPSIRDLRIAINRILQSETGIENKTDSKEIIMHSSISQKKLQISTSEGIKIINLSDIEFLEADGSYTVFHLTNKSAVIESKHLKSFESVLSDKNFYRVGRTYIINIDCIKLYNKHSGGCITMESGSKIIVPRRKKDEFIKYLNSYLEALK